MLTIRKQEDRGYADHGWLQARHSFSFAEYDDPAHRHFGSLRVINEDRVAPGTGFGMHGHRDMEIITYVLQGSLRHQDSMGNGSLIQSGNVQYMSAGRGVRHSEFNASPTEGLHLLQIWIEPAVSGGEPGYRERPLNPAETRGRLVRVASPDGAEQSIRILQDAVLYVGHFDGSEAATLPLAAGRRAYVHVARGQLTVNGTLLQAGDAAKLEQEAALQLQDGQAAEVLVFDLA